MDNDFGSTSGNEQDQGNSQGQSAPPPFPANTSGGSSAPFGGAPATPVTGYGQQKPKRNWFPWISCLVVVVILGFLGFAGIAVVGAILDQVSLAPIESKFTGKNKTIGVIRIEGAIYDETDTLNAIKHYREKGIDTYLLRINSPGGAVGPSQEIYEAIQDLRVEDNALVVASMGGVAASGGYYIASAADRIYTNKGTMTGSIGVIMSLPDFKNASDKLGIGVKTIKSGKFKDTPSTLRDLTPEEQAMLQNVIDDTYDQFVNDILRMRSDALEMKIQELLQNADAEEYESLDYLGDDVMPVAGDTAESYLKRIADGRVMTGRQAFTLGLVDAIGTQQDAVDWLSDQRGIAEPSLYEYVPVRTLSEILGASAQSTLDSVGLPLHGARLEFRMPY